MINFTENPSIGLPMNIWLWGDPFFKNLKCRLKSLKDWNILACPALWGRCQTLTPCPWDYWDISATRKLVGIPWKINLRRENVHMPANIIITTSLHEHICFGCIGCITDLKPNPTDKHHEAAQKRSVSWYELQCMATVFSVRWKALRIVLARLSEQNRCNKQRQCLVCDKANETV